MCVNCLNQFTHTKSRIDRDECSAISLAEATRRFKCIRRPCFLHGSQQYLRTSIDMTRAQRSVKAQIRKYNVRVILADETTLLRTQEWILIRQKWRRQIQPCVVLRGY